VEVFVYTLSLRLFSLFTQETHRLRRALRARRLYPLQTIPSGLDYTLSLYPPLVRSIFRSIFRSFSVHFPFIFRSFSVHFPFIFRSFSVHFPFIFRSGANASISASAYACLRLLAAPPYCKSSYRHARPRPHDPGAPVKPKRWAGARACPPSR